MDVFKFSCEGGRDRRSGSAETKGVSAKQVKTGKKFARRRKDFAKPRCSEPRTGFTDARGAARFRAKSRGFEKSIPLTYEEGIDRRVSSGFRKTEYYAKQRSRFSETEEDQEGWMQEEASIPLLFLLRLLKRFLSSFILFEVDVYC